MSTRVVLRPIGAQGCPPAPRVEQASRALRPGGAQGCSHGWSESALRLAEPVDPVRETRPAPEGRRSLPTRAKNSAAPPGRMNPPTRVPRVAPAKRGLHLWLQPGVPSGRSNPPRGCQRPRRVCSIPCPQAAAHFLRPSPGLRAVWRGLRAPAPPFPTCTRGLRGVGAGLRHAATGLRGAAPGLRGAAPLPSGPLGRSSGSLVASADSSGRPSGPAVASAGSSGRRDNSPGRRDRSSVACDSRPVAWRGRAPEPRRPSFPWPSRGVAGGPSPASADRSRPPSRTARPPRRQSF